MSTARRRAAADRISGLKSETDDAGDVSEVDRRRERYWRLPRGCVVCGTRLDPGGPSHLVCESCRPVCEERFRTTGSFWSAAPAVVSPDEPVAEKDGQDL
jgi:hypothetical protein